MSVTVRIPTTLRVATQGAKELTLEGAKVGEILDNLCELYPSIRERIFNADGALQRFTNVFLGDDDIRQLEGLDTPTANGSELFILPAYAGG